MRDDVQLIDRSCRSLCACTVRQACFLSNAYLMLAIDADTAENKSETLRLIEFLGVAKGRCRGAASGSRGRFRSRPDAMRPALVLAFTAAKWTSKVPSLAVDEVS